MLYVFFMYHHIFMYIFILCSKASVSESSRPMLLRGAQACGLTSSQRRYVLSGDSEGWME